MDVIVDSGKSSFTPRLLAVVAIVDVIPRFRDHESLIKVVEIRIRKLLVLKCKIGPSRYWVLSWTNLTRSSILR
jgi:hypothetical protein